ncbi:MAG: phosphonate C-P lyase system protein PhnK [Desulfobacterales bacterium]|jgi:putative phosphonate transport system ATP-binding protein
MRAPTPSLLQVRDLCKYYGRYLGCRQIDFDLQAGEVLAVVGESGSGKSTLLACAAGLMAPSSGQVVFDSADGPVDLCACSEVQRRQILRAELGIVHQNPRDGLRLRISAGGNIGERLMANGWRHYGRIREAAGTWLERVEIDADRLDDLPSTFSGGMQQRLQIARSLVTRPRLVFMDEPTSGLDVSVQARLLDILRRLVSELALSLVFVTHDLGVARLLAHRMMVMQRGEVIEMGLTDQVLDDPQHPYTQLLVSSILRN